MKTNEQLYDERLHRIKTAVDLGKPDRTPVVPLGDSFCAKHLGVKLAAYVNDIALSNQVALKSFGLLGEIDGIQFPCYSPRTLGIKWLSSVKLPGEALGEDELWQVEEKELMTREDYDAIIDRGFNEFLSDFYMNRLNNLMAVAGPIAAYMPQAVQNARDAGIVSLSPSSFTIPYEYFCGGRTMVNFVRDIFKIPDKVEAAMDVAIDSIIESARISMRKAKPIGTWVGGWRSASEFLAPKAWNRFVWPYMKRLAEAIVEEGVIPVFHLDSNWERDLEYFRELPKARCIISPDGSTDIYKIKEVLGDHMCIMGDVPASLLALGTPDEVFAYCDKLIRDIGPSGYILAQGCDIPPNAKPENVKAMISAATGK